VFVKKVAIEWYLNKDLIVEYLDLLYFSKCLATYFDDLVGNNTFILSNR
jgi:hypothetical protein